MTQDTPPDTTPVATPVASEEIGGLASAVAAVYTQCDGVVMTGWNEYHKYDYATFHDYAAALTPPMGECGLALVPLKVDELKREVIPGNNGDQVVVEVEVTFALVHESGERLEVVTRGVGGDSPANGGYLLKAQQQATKVAMSSIFRPPVVSQLASMRRELARVWQKRLRKLGNAEPRLRLVGPEVAQVTLLFCNWRRFADMPNDMVGEALDAVYSISDAAIIDFIDQVISQRKP